MQVACEGWLFCVHWVLELELGSNFVKVGLAAAAFRAPHSARCKQLSGALGRLGEFIKWERSSCVDTII